MCQLLSKIRRGDGHAGAAVVQDKGHLIGFECCVDRDNQCAQFQRPKIGRKKRRNIGQHDCDPVSTPDTDCGQHVGAAAAQLIQLTIGENFVLKK